MLNLVCRNLSLRQTVIDNLKSVFKQVLHKKVPEDVNECVYCLPSHRQSDLDISVDSKKLPKSIYSAAKVLQEVVQMESKCSRQDVPKLASQLDGLELL